MVLGILRSFGVLFPVLMAEFETSRERTGKWTFFTQKLIMNPRGGGGGILKKVL